MCFLAIVVSVGLYISSPVLFRILFPTYTASESSLAVSYFRIMVWGMCLHVQSVIAEPSECGKGLCIFFSGGDDEQCDPDGGCLPVWASVRIAGNGGGGAGILYCPVCVPSGEEQILWKSDAEIWTEGFQNHQTLYTDVAYLLGNAFSEINQLVDKSLLSAMEDGTVTAVSYASVLYQFASNMIGIPMTTIIYTELAESFAAERYRKALRDEEFISAFTSVFQSQLLLC